MSSLVKYIWIYYGRITAFVFSLNGLNEPSPMRQLLGIETVFKRLHPYCVAVSIRTLDFKTRSHQRSLFNPTDISKEVYEISKQLFAELWDGVSPLRLMGISLTNITKEDTPQLTLFQDDKREKASKLDKATDALNARFGTATIVRGSSMQSNLDVGKKHKAQVEEKNKSKH